MKGKNYATHYRFLNPKFSMHERIRKFSRVLIKHTGYSGRIPAKSRMWTGERMCLRFRRDPPMGGSLLTQRGWHSAPAGEKETRRELLVQTGPGVCRRRRNRGWGFVKRTRRGGDRARRKNTRVPSATPRVFLVAANGISNASCDRRFSMELLLRIQPHYVPATYFWGWADVTMP